MSHQPASAVPLQTVADFARRWLPTEWTLDKLFEWPPDVFAFTSTLLQRTGAYRYAASPPPPEAWPPRGDPTADHETPDWSAIVEEVADEWLDAVEHGGRLPDRVQSAIRTLTATGKVVQLEAMREVQGAGRAWDLVRTVLELHAYADRCCKGFGSPAIHSRYRHSRTQYLTDLLLSRTGSVSRLPRDLGMVLPKMRTPQSGVTLRALSHYATYSDSELHVAWRSLPWVNIDEDTVNALVIPWPFEVKATDFKPRSRVGAQLRSGRARYFAFQPKERTLNVDAVVDLVKKSAEHSRRVHVLVFPELALTAVELEALQDALADSLPRTRVPIVVAGVRTPIPNASSESGPRLSGRKSGPDEDCNKVVLSLFFAERWYNLEQDKHHRWKLDPRQIEQYNLGGTLTGTSPWWEACEVGRRTLTFLAPNDWLVLSPLVCEDLAQLEPVSEVIRGVGPTLVWAVLLDGPQLPHRWPARYAGVLADDPGSSVLTVTSAGMVRRSTRLHKQEGASDTGTVALWTDSQFGARATSLPDSAAGVVLTLAVEWKAEHTLDGRSDGGKASQFVRQGEFPLIYDRSLLTATHRQERKGRNGRKRHTREARDLREVAAFTIFVDAALEADATSRRQFAEWVLATPTTIPARIPGRTALNEMLVLVCGAAEVRPARQAAEGEDGSPRSKQRRDDTQEFEAAVRLCLSVLTNFEAPKRIAASMLWAAIVSHICAAQQEVRDGKRLHLPPECRYLGLSRSATTRVYIAVWDALLWAIHTRLTEERREATLRREGADLLEQIESALNREPGELID